MGVDGDGADADADLTGGGRGGVGEVADDDGIGGAGLVDERGFHLGGSSFGVCSIVDWGTGLTITTTTTEEREGASRV